MRSYSQSGQDLWVLDIFKDKNPSDLFFVDCAAYNGVDLSNTYLLEELGWKGICIEANRRIFPDLLKSRSSVCYNVVCLDYDGRIGFYDNVGWDACGNVMEGTDYPCFRLPSLLGTQKVVDYLSLDVEGSELKVLQGIDFNEYLIKCITVEHNLYFVGDTLKNNIFDLLSANGFVRVKEDVCVGIYPFEDWYLHKSML